MNNLNKLFVKSDSSIKNALSIIEHGKIKLALVVDNNNRLIGTLSDGDIRRGLLENQDLDQKIESIYCLTPFVANINDTKQYIIDLCISNQINQIPVLDNNNQIIRLEVLNDLLSKKKYDNTVILMVGGLGTRLMPITQNTPKPMLKIGDKPILQTIVEQIHNCGFSNIIMCVGYKSDIIQEFFGDGVKFGVNIEYLVENERMGTIGALSLLEDNQKPNEPFIVMNGDILTKIRFNNLLDFHIASDAEATISVKNYDFMIPYGVVNVKGDTILSIEEKPVKKLFVSAGIYVLNPSLISELNTIQYLDITDFFKTLMASKKSLKIFPISEYWLDIGSIEEFERANNEFDQEFNV